MKIFLSLLFLFSLSLQTYPQEVQTFPEEKFIQEFTEYFYRIIYRLNINDVDLNDEDAVQELLSRDSAKIFSIGIEEARNKLDSSFSFFKELSLKYLSQVDSSKQHEDYEQLLYTIEEVYMMLLDFKKNFATGEYIFRKDLFDVYGEYYEDSLRIKLEVIMPEKFKAEYGGSVNNYIDREIFREWAFPRYDNMPASEDFAPPGDVPMSSQQSTQPQLNNDLSATDTKENSTLQATPAVTRLKEAEALKAKYERELSSSFRGENSALDFLKKEN